MTSWTVTRQAPLSMGLPRQEYWNELPFHTPRDLPDPGIKPMSLVSPALAGRFFTTASPGKLKFCFSSVQFSRSVMSDSLRPPWPARLLCPWDSPGQEYWSGLPFPTPRDLPDPGIKPMSPALACRFFTTMPCKFLE